MDLRNKTTSEFRTVLDSPLGFPNFQVPLYTVFVLSKTSDETNVDFIMRPCTPRQTMEGVSIQIALTVCDSANTNSR